MISVIILTHNAESFIKKQLLSIKEQTLQPKEILILDSESKDQTILIIKKFKNKNILKNIQIIPIKKEEFNHGETRTYGAKIAKQEFLLYLTDDAILANKNSFQNMLEFMQNHNDLALCFGKQLPHKNASIFASHLRGFNYPEQNYIRSIQDKYQYGIKTCFSSDSFCMYRKTILKKIEYFPKTNFGEDTLVAGKALLQNYKIAYFSKAEVFHSHNYTLLEEFYRYKEIGTFHKKNLWLLKEFGSSNSEGFKYVLSEINYLKSFKKKYLIPLCLIRNFFKLLGYKMG